MNRRAFIALPGTLAFWGVSHYGEIPKLVAVADVHAAGHRPGTEVLIDGKRVPLCHRAEQYDDGTVVAFCFQPGPDGRPFFCSGTQDVARMTLRGPGRIVFPT